MTHEHDLGTVARWATRRSRLLPILAIFLAAPVVLHGSEAGPRVVGTKPPTGKDDAYGAHKNKPLNVDAAHGVLANDTEPDGDIVSISSAVTTDIESKGSFTLNPDGSFSYTPTTDFVGFASFTYVPKDDVDGDGSGATVVIEVSNNGKAPDFPVAVIAADDTTVTTSDSVSFDGTASESLSGTTITEYNWDFGDGNLDTGATTSHTYGADGLYIASLTVKDDLTLNSETVYLPILVSNGTTGDGRMYVKKAQFAVSWSKHAAGMDADKFKISGVWNPSGFPADLNLAGMSVVVLINGQAVDVGNALDEKGKFTSAKGSSPSLKFAFNAAKGTYSIAGSLMDLRGFLGVIDQNDDTTLPIAVEVILFTVVPDNADCFAQLDTLYKSTKGKSAKASYTFAKNATPTGNFVSLKTSGTENPDTGGHKISASGVIAGDLSTDIDPTGNITINIGSAPQIVLQASNHYTVTGTGHDAVITLVKGAVPELSKFTISNPKGKFQLATNELTGVGLDLAGTGGTANDLTITIVVPVASGNLTFITNVELLRKDVNSTKWKR